MAMGASGLSQHRGAVHLTESEPIVRIEIVIKCMQTICQFPLTSHIDPKIKRLKYF